MTPEENDVDRPFFPVLGVLDGTPVFLDFLVAEDHPFSPFNRTEITQEGVFNFWLLGDLVPLDTGTSPLTGFEPTPLPPDYTLPVLINVVVPEPSGIAFAAVSGLGLGGMIFSRWRRRHARG